MGTLAVPQTASQVLVSATNQIVEKKFEGGEENSWAYSVGSRVGSFIGGAVGFSVGLPYALGQNLNISHAKNAEAGKAFGAEVATYVLCTLGAVGGLTADLAFETQQPIVATLGGIAFSNYFFGSITKKSFGLIGGQLAKAKSVLENTVGGTYKTTFKAQKLGAKWGSFLAGGVASVIGTVGSTTSRFITRPVNHLIGKSIVPLTGACEQLAGVVLPILALKVVESVYFEWGLAELFIGSSIIELSKLGMTHLTSSSSKSLAAKVGTLAGYALASLGVIQGYLNKGVLSLLGHCAQQATAAVLSWNEGAIPKFAIEQYHLIKEKSVDFVASQQQQITEISKEIMSSYPIELMVATSFVALVTLGLLSQRCFRR